VKLQTNKRRAGAFAFVLAAVFAGSLLSAGQARADWDDHGDHGYRGHHHEEYREYREYREHYRPRYEEYRDHDRVYYGYPQPYYGPSGLTIYLPWLR
jgi:hypothetical protein